VTTYVVVNPEGDAIAEGLTAEEAGRLILSFCSHHIAPSIEGWTLSVNGTPCLGLNPWYTRDEAVEALRCAVARHARIADGWPAETIRDPAPAP